jgi:hypothetical protein
MSSQMSLQTSIPSSIESKRSLPVVILQKKISGSSSLVLHQEEEESI